MINTSFDSNQGGLSCIRTSVKDQGPRALVQVMADQINGGLDDRYDRQLMIWGHSGQDLLSQSHVCVVDDNQTLLMRECVKSLALMGIHEITVVFGSSNGSDFVNKSNSDILGFDALESMNPDVTFHIWNENAVPIDSQHKLWNSFSIVICLCTAGPLLQRVMKLSAVPLIMASTNDNLGFVRLIGSEPHCVIDSHGHFTFDLRLNRMWPELAEYHESFDIKNMSQEEVSSLPYSVLLYNVGKSLKSKNIPINRKSVRAEFIELHDSILSGPLTNDLNFVEAERSSFLLYDQSGPFPHNLTNILNSFHAEPNSTINRWVYQFVRCIRIFYDLRGDLPVSAFIPDMESSTKLFNAQKAVYQRKAAKDKSEIMRILAKENYSLIPEPLIDKMLENLKHLDAIKMGSLSSATRTISEKPKFNKLLSLQNDRHDTTFVSPAMASILGAMVSQECVKLLTHQYVPVENTLLYDGDSNETSTFIL